MVFDLPFSGERAVAPSLSSTGSRLLRHDSKLAVVLEIPREPLKEDSFDPLGGLFRLRGKLSSHVKSALTPDLLPSATVF